MANDGKVYCDAYAINFNEGSDARIVGIVECPYPSSSHQGRYWRRGWMDVDLNWGSHAKWHTVKLPVISSSSLSRIYK